MTVNVVAGAASASYTLPAGTDAGTYIIEAVYNGTTNFLGYTDTSQTLIINAAATATAAASASVTFITGAQDVTLNATITSAAGVVDEGTETFTILNGTTVIGAPVTVNVSAGAASASYALPAGTGAGTYIIQAVYNGTTNFLGYTDTSQTLIINAAATATAAASASVTFVTGAQNVTLNATVTSSAGVVDEGTETFTILNGTTVIGAPVTVNVAAGAASAAYALPAGTGAGTYIIQAVYNGTTNFLGYTDTSQTLTINAAATATAAASASVTFVTGAQNVTLNATVTSAAGVVDEGTETFTILNGTTVIGAPVTVNVAAGAASAAYALPAGTGAGTYIIQAVYNGTTNFLGYTDTSQTLTINAAATATAAASASVTFVTGAQNVTLNATVTSAAGVVDEGTETFTILNGTTPVGDPVTVNVAAGAASAAYALPAGTGAGTYIIQAVYNGTTNFLGYTDTSQTLTINAAATATAAASASVTFSPGEQDVTLNATVTSAAGEVDEGTETFTILNGTTPVGDPVTVNVAAGAASAAYALPAGTGAGTYIIQAVYNGTTNFLGYTDTSQTLTISAAASATAAASASVTFNTGVLDVPLSATVTSPAGVVDEGTETFTILNGTTPVGDPVTVNVSAGAASASYALPAGTGAGTYIIQAVYNGTVNFGGSSDASQPLTISAAATATAAASASVVFSPGAQDVTLNATVTSAAGVVDEGTETFTILNGTTPVGDPVTVNVAAGAASASYALPAGIATGTYIIQAVYNGTTNFLGYTDTSQMLTVSAAASATAAASASVTFSTGVLDVPLSATVTSSAGEVDEGTVTFTILNGTTPVGDPVTVNVSAGAASASYALPAGTGAGTYIIQAVYNGTVNFGASSDTSQTLTINAAASATAAASASVTFSPDAQDVSLSATVTSAAGTVDEGTETFTILNGTIAVGDPVTVNVAAGAASASYALPAGTPAGTYIIQAVYNGTPDFDGSSDNSQTLTISAAATATAAASASATFSLSPQDVPLSATITSPAGTVDEGTETFTILSGTTPVGDPVTVNVSAGAASASYVLPAGTEAGTYIIQAVYNGTADFGGSSDNSQPLTISAAATATAAASASVTFSTGVQDVSLSATVTSAAGTVDEGTETFTILNGTIAVGDPVTVNVAAGAASASYALPAGTPAGTYIIQAVYNGTPDFGGSSDNSQSLIISAAATATAAASASATFSLSPQDVPLSATITSSAGTVDEGTVTFTILNGTTPVGDPVTVNVSAGAASASYTLPAGTGAGTYIIQAVYNGTADFGGSSDNSQPLTITAAASTTAAANASVPFSPDAQNVTLSATVTSPAGVVDEGTETFTILNGTTPIGTPVTVNVAAGAASAVYVLPAGTPDGPYTIQAVYNGTPDLSGSSDTSHQLTVTGPYISVSANSVQWGSETVALYTATDGVRLLPMGRNTDLPWFNINQITITLSQSAVVNPGDVSVTGITGGNYGPVTITGSGTSNITITFAKVIANADRVTLTIGNAQIIPYTRRLDVLPGDVNDDGVVNTTDGLYILYNETPAHPYQAIYDMNGDGSVNMADFTLYRPKIGTVLPPIPDTVSGNSLSALVDLALGVIDQEDFADPLSPALESATITNRQRTQISLN